MFRGYMPALTFLVFGIGLGLGVSWSRGLIPLSLEPAKSGSLGVEVTHREPLPPPNSAEFGADRPSQNATQEAIPDDPVVFEQQTEPESDVDSSSVAEANTTRDTNRRHVIPALRETEPSESAPLEFIRQHETDEPVAQAHERIHRQDQQAARNNSKTVNQDVPANRRTRPVTVVAHQDPSAPANDAQDAVPTEALSAHDLLAAAEEKLNAGDTLAAHRSLSKLYWSQKEFRPQIQERIDEVAKQIFFQSQPHFVEPYIIQPGERLETVAKKYQLSWEYLAKLNRTEPRRIQIGQKLKVMKGPFGAVVDLHDFALTIHLQGYYVKQYPVCIGKNGSSPIGKFTVLNKVENPPYTGPDGKVIAADDPANPLGERWIDLGDSYGIHGTIDPDSIGKAESRGCIRMRDRDIIEVYNFLVRGSEVAIRK